MDPLLQRAPLGKGKLCDLDSAGRRRLTSRPDAGLIDSVSNRDVADNVPI